MTNEQAQANFALANIEMRKALDNIAEAAKHAVNAIKAMFESIAPSIQEIIKRYNLLVNGATHKRVKMHLQKTYSRKKKRHVYKMC